MADLAANGVTDRMAPKTRRLIAENPHDAVVAQLHRYTSVTLAKKLVERRSESSCNPLSGAVIDSKAIGIAYSLRSALGYLKHISSDELLRRVVSLYYGAMALAQAEMLALPEGSVDLDETETATKRGHGLFALPGPSNDFADIQVGVLSRGFLPKWLKSMGHSTSDFPGGRVETYSGLVKRGADHFCSLRDLFASMPEIDDLFDDVFGGPPNWISVAYDSASSSRPSTRVGTGEKPDSTNVLCIDKSGKISEKKLATAGWPLTIIEEAQIQNQSGRTFRARVEHPGHEYWWGALPTHNSPNRSGSTLLFPTLGQQREYRTIAITTLYVLSIVARYMPSTWHRIEGGDEDQYLALLYEAIAVWERLLPQLFLESITGDTVHTAMPGSLFA